jgi:hypothetical protein
VLSSSAKYSTPSLALARIHSRPRFLLLTPRGFTLFFRYLAGICAVKVWKDSKREKVIAGHNWMRMMVHKGRHNSDFLLQKNMKNGNHKGRGVELTGQHLDSFQAPWDPQWMRVRVVAYAHNYQLSVKKEHWFSAKVSWLVELALLHLRSLASKGLPHVSACTRVVWARPIARVAGTWVLWCTKEAAAAKEREIPNEIKCWFRDDMIKISIYIRNREAWEKKKDSKGSNYWTILADLKLKTKREKMWLNGRVLGALSLCNLNF